MADFLYLFRGGDPDTGNSPEQLQAHMARWGEWIGRLREEGRFKAGDPLEGDGYVLSGKARSITDGPYAEAKDVVGGYLLVTSDDLSSAAEMAKGCPIFDNGGTVEVRQIRAM